MASISPLKARNESVGTGDFLNAAFDDYHPNRIDNVTWQTLDAEDDLIHQSQRDDATAEVLRDLAALTEQTTCDVSSMDNATLPRKRERNVDDDIHSSNERPPAKRQMSPREARQVMNETVSRQRVAEKNLESSRADVDKSQRQCEEARKDYHLADKAVSETSHQLCDTLLEEDSSWNKSYKLLVKFREKYGHTRVPRNPSREQKMADPNLSKLAGWVGRQRTNYRRPLNDDRRPEEYQIIALKKIGFDFDPHRTVWLNKYDEIKRFKALHGHFDVPSRTSKHNTSEDNQHSEPNDYSSLSIWVKRQQYQYKLFRDGNPASEMTEERIRLLEDIGFPWKKRARQWMERYNALKQFKEATGHTQPPNTAELKTLSEWTKDQRRQLKKYDEDPSASNLSEEQATLLRELSLTMDLRASSWSKQFEELMEFQEQHGHCILPSKYPLNQKLASWVATQRRHYALLLDGKPSQITEERIKRLTNAGFEWKVSKERREEASRTLVKTWDEVYAELVERQVEMGTLDVENDKELKSWLCEQKEQCQLIKAGQPSQLTASQLSKLVVLGIVEPNESLASTGDDGVDNKPAAVPTLTDTFQAAVSASIRAFKPADTKTWEESYTELLTFRLKHNSFQVPTSHSLHSWIQEQRIEYNKYVMGYSSALIIERIRKLNFVGFPWSEHGRSISRDPSKSWEEMFAELVAFRVRYQSFDVPVEQMELYRWMEEQRSMLRQRQCNSCIHPGETFDLVETRLRKLQEIGFPWNGFDAPAPVPTLLDGAQLTPE